MEAKWENDFTIDEMGAHGVIGWREICCYVLAIPGGPLFHVIFTLLE